MLPKILQKLAVVCIKIYRATLSNQCWGSCRFYPSCSTYALEAFETFGAWKGLWLCCTRLMRCHPLCNGGYDPVPTSSKACLQNKPTKKVK